MVEKTSKQDIDLSSLRADPDVTETKLISGVEFEFRTKLFAKTIRDLDMNPDTNPEWEFDLQHVIVKSPILTQEEFDGMDAKSGAELTVECLDIAGLNARPTFR